MASFRRLWMAASFTLVATILSVTFSTASAQRLAETPIPQSKEVLKFDGSNPIDLPDPDSAPAGRLLKPRNGMQNNGWVEQTLRYSTSNWRRASISVNTLTKSNASVQLVNELGQVIWSGYGILSGSSIPISRGVYHLHAKDPNAVPVSIRID